MSIKSFLESTLGSIEGRATIWHRPGSGPKAPITASAWYNYPADIDKMVDDAEKLANHDVYFSPLVYTTDSRTPEVAGDAQTVWCDADTADPNVFRLEPSYVVQSSEGRWQLYWNLDEPVRAAEASRVARSICHAHKDEGADTSSWPSNKLMRVIGTSNSNWGFSTEVTGYATGNIYGLADLEDAYSDVVVDAPAPKPTGVVAIEPADLPNFLDAQSLLPQSFDIRLITQEPQIGSEGNRSQMREKLILECMRSGLDDLHTAAIAWNSKCGEKYHDGREDLLWYEIAKFRALVDEESGTHAEVAPVDERPVLISGSPKRVDLLTKAERKLAQAHWDSTFPGEYERYVKEAVKIYNAPYHRAMIMVILSAALGDTASIYEAKRPLRLNFYIAPLGPTTTGKSEAMAMATKVIHGAFPKNDNPDIGSDASPSALTQKLHKRNGKTTVFKADEADGIIEQWVGKNGFHTGMLQFMTKLFDGWVEPQNRSGDVDGEYAECVFTMCLMGTESGLSSVLTRKMFESGFLARMCWFIGEQVEVPRALLGFKMGTVGGALSDRKRIEKWANKWSAIREDWMFHKIKPGSEFIQFENDAVAQYFLEKTQHFEHDLFKNHRNYDIIKPSIIRIVRSMVKLAALVAIEDGRKTIGMNDVLLAIMQGEELFGNLEYMSTVISDSALAKSTNDLEMWIAGRPQQVAKIEEVYRSHAGVSKREIDDLLTQLLVQGRVGQIKEAVTGAISYEIRSA